MNCFLKAIRFSVVLFMLYLPCAAQPLYPADYFRSPLDTVILLSAPFGQLRDNHFHSGLDIRTFEKEGLPVYAVADGWVSRIKISPWGYGNALYIDHPNGYSSVYGHLQRYNDTIAAHIKAIQYQKESFEAESFPRKNHIPVKKGDIIAFTGNSGGSTGPHLHFELRNTRTEHIINPLLFNMPVTDSIAPFFRSFTVYNLVGNHPLPIQQQKIAPSKLITDSNGIITYTDTMVIPEGTIGFGLEVYDYISDQEREQNVYMLQMNVDSQQLFEMDMRSFSFPETRFINVHMDYARYWDDRIRIQKCFVADGNGAGLYKTATGKGKYVLADTLAHIVQFTATDAMGNKSIFRLPLKKHASQKLSAGFMSDCSFEIFYPSTQNHYQLSHVKVEIPKHSLYDTLDFCIETRPANKHTRSKIYRIGTATIPTHSGCNISIKAEAKDSALHNKLLLVRVSEKGNISSAGGSYHNGWVSSSGRSFGDYAIGLDSTAPKARFLHLEKDTLNTDSTALIIEIKDNLSGVDDYRLTKNGKWVLAEFDAKNDLLIYRYDENTGCGQKQTFELILTDRRKNKTIVQKEIFIPCKN